MHAARAARSIERYTCGVRNMNILRGYKRRAVYTLLGAATTMLLIGTAAELTREPFIFPSLGPTALMLFAHPLRKDSSPRHAIIGHAIGAGCGYAALALMGLLAVPFAPDVTMSRVCAAAIALGLTAAVMTLARSEHAPAGATTLIVALGLLPRLADFVAIMLAVASLTLLCLIINRLFGIDYPLWNPTDYMQHNDAMSRLSEPR
jgi:CBS domain-containing membrane protein